MKSFTKSKRLENLGPVGEEIAVLFLKREGYSIIAQNFRKKWGEIDIIATNKKGILSFLEVKTVTCEIADASEEGISRVTNRHFPEERVHKDKSIRLSRTVQSYLLERGMMDEEWSVGVIAVFADPKTKKAYVRFLPDVTLQ
jgi:Holliday junction resolvase-like predicted endonuclease